MSARTLARLALTPVIAAFYLGLLIGAMYLFAAVIAWLERVVPAKGGMWCLVGVMALFLLLMLGEMVHEAWNAAGRLLSRREP